METFARWLSAGAAANDGCSAASRAFKRKDILNMEKTKPSFEDGRKGLFGSGSTSCQIVRPSQIIGCLLFQRLDSQFQSQGPHPAVLRAERCLIYQLLRLVIEEVCFNLSWQL